MISIKDISHYVGGKQLYEDISLQIKPSDKIGLVGYNGAGKSTLMNIIAGNITPDLGTVSKSKDYTIGFLNQDLLSYETSDSIRTVALQAFESLREVQAQIDATLHQMETNYTEDLVDKLADLQDKFAQLGGYDAEAKAEKVLEGIGFSTSDLDRPMNEFSGGWRMRVMLAKLLLQQPSLLMLDEPTNHLDLVSIQWVENYLKNYPQAVIVISHDRRFLDNFTNKTVVVANRSLQVYAGNYSFYEKEKVIQQEVQQNAYENQQKKIEQDKRFIERFRSKATKASQVQSRIKALDRMDLVEAVEDDTPIVRINFNMAQEPGKQIATFSHISKAYGELNLLRDAKGEISRGDKIALVGANGKGKSTLLRLIAKDEPLDSGSITLGHNVSLAFYAQHQLESLNLENTVLQEMQQIGEDKSEQELRKLLGAFLFRKDDVHKKLNVLSGGEKARVALAKVLIMASNFLLLDEPTNHLDMMSINVLIQALQQYQGTFVVVSHNRHFIEQVANKIWYIQDQQLKVFPGTYQEYEYWLKQNQL